LASAAAGATFAAFYQAPSLRVAFSGKSRKEIHVNGNVVALGSVTLVVVGLWSSAAPNRRSPGREAEEGNCHNRVLPR